MPDTKPDLWFNEAGICAACLAYESRASVDWVDRLAQLRGIVDRHKTPHYDCIVPSSGGKDSHFQVLTMLSLGYRPLVVTATTDHLTDLGRRNIENLKRQGVDTIEVTPDPVLRRRINRLGLETIGDISYPEHVAIFTIPVRFAVRYHIPLIVWGENSQHEYGGPATSQESSTLTRRWLEEFGGLNGMRASELPTFLNVPERDCWLYTYPSDEELKLSGVTGIFLGYFVPWDGQHNAQIAQAHGFETYPGYVEGSACNYENLDNAQTGVHDYFKYLKFGFGRATDICCSLIRRGRLTRDEGWRIVQQHDGRYPASYLGVSLYELLDEIGMTRERFDEVCEEFTNWNLFDGVRDDGSPRLR